MGGTWEAHGRHMGATWEPHGSYMGATWEQPGSNLGATWEPDGRLVCRTEGHNAVAMWKIIPHNNARPQTQTQHTHYPLTSDGYIVADRPTDRIRIGMVWVESMGWDCASSAPRPFAEGAPKNPKP